MRFAVPQFIDVEDKIFGPLTLKQAVYLAGGVGVALVLLTRFGFFFAVLIGGPFAFLGFALAFLKINNRPFAFIVYAAVFYSIKNKLYLWKKTQPRTSTQANTPMSGQATAQPLVPHLSQSRLKELAWSLDTNDSLYSSEKQWKQ
jgi:hypothetical protein